MKPKKHLDTHRRKNIIALTIIAAALLLPFAVKLYWQPGITGHAVVQTDAGTITQLEVIQKFTTGYWQGYYGLELQLPGYNETQTDQANPGETDEKHLVFECLQPGKTHELYATVVDPSLLNWSSIRAGTTAMLDSFMNISANITDSANKTFTGNYTFEVGNTNITVPTVFTKQYNNASSKIFPVGILNVSGQFVVVTKKSSTTVRNFRNSVVNYQIMVPLPNLTKTYYFLADPFDVCPAGLGIGLTGDGIAAGTAMDNETGLPINNATITIGASANSTNSNGTYNFSIAIGSYSLIATKEGYLTFFAPINISFTEATTLNFNMTRFYGYTDRNGTITGYVFDNSSGLPVSGAAISVAGKVASTNGSGYYIMNASPGTHNIVATKAGYESYVSNITVIANQTVQRNITIGKLLGTIEGYVTDSYFGITIRNATILVAGRIAYTDSSGYYAVNISDGQHTFMANKTGYEAHVSVVTVVRGNTTSHNVTLTLLTGFISGYVHDNSTGQLLSNATVSIAGSSYTTNSSGFYNLSAPKGTNNIVAVKDGYNSYAANITIVSGTVLQHNISLSSFFSPSQNGTVIGFVTDNATNMSITGATISINGINTTTNGSGFYAINATPGNHYLVAIKESYDPYFTQVAVQPGQTTKKNITLVSKAAKGIHGNVTVIANQTMNANISAYTLTLFNFSNSTINFSATLGVIANKNITNASLTVIVLVSVAVIRPDIPIVATYYDFYSPIINSTDIVNITYNITYAQRDVPYYFNESYLAAYHYNTTSESWKRLNSTIDDVANTVMFALSHMSLYVLGLRTGHITGNVTEQSTGSRLSDVTVSAGGTINRTNSQGTYVLDSVSAGANSIIAIKNGYNSYANTTNVEPDSIVAHNISLTIPPGTLGNGTIKGLVKDELGAVISGATVSVAGKTMQTTSSGFYSANLSEGTHMIVATKTSYENFIGNVTIMAGNTTDKNITMKIFVPSVIIQQVSEGKGEGTGTGKTAIVQPTNIRVPPKIIDYEMSLEKITAKLKKGTYTTFPLLIKNYKKSGLSISFNVEGDAKELLKLSKNSLVISPDSQDTTEVTILANTDPGIYTGKLRIEGDLKKELPIEILIYSEDMLPVEALLLRLELIDSSVNTGGRLRYRMELKNMLQEEGFDVKLQYNISDRKNFTAMIDSDSIRLRTANVLMKSSELPKDLKPGDYILVIKADYLNTYSVHTGFFKITEPIYKYSFLGVPLWAMVAAAGILATGTFATLTYKKRKLEKKRYKMALSQKNLPKAGPESLFIGTIADTEMKAYMDMGQLPLHTLISGASGTGKTIAAQIIAEEAMQKGLSVVVIDPTAQWTGFLRQCTDKKMLALYAKFGMRHLAAKPFNGNIKVISSENESIDFKKLMKPEEINIFVTKGLGTDQLELFIAAMIDKIFAENFPEAKTPKYLIIIDGIHQLLPKFGGSGKVFVKIERAVREFRKWGIGVAIISQTTSDFSEEIKANLNTQIIHRIRDEKDMELIKEEYGEEILQSLIKADSSVAMIENASYNQGKPYFIRFRPIMHDPGRISDDELANYSKYNRIVSETEYAVDQLESMNVDVFDLRLGVKMVTDKVKAGNFSMADIYLEDLKTSLDTQFRKIGKTPQKKIQNTPKKESPQEAHEAATAATASTPATTVPIQKLIEEIYTSLESGNRVRAQLLYPEMQKQYVQLSVEDKARIIEKCIDIRNRITVQNNA